MTLAFEGAHGADWGHMEQIVQFYCRAPWKIGFIAKRVTLCTVTIYFNLIFVHLYICLCAQMSNELRL